MTAINLKRVGRLVLVDIDGYIPKYTLQAIGPALERMGKMYPSLNAYLQEQKLSPAHFCHYTIKYQCLTVYSAPCAQFTLQVILYKEESI